MGPWLDSARGIHPLGPALFAIAIQEHIIAAKTETNQRYQNTPNGGLDIVGFYLDDGAVAGDAEAVCYFATA